MISSGAELKQSSLDSFFRKSPPQVCVSANAAASISSSSALAVDAATDYERERRENIRRNRDFLLKLGISCDDRAPKSNSRLQGHRNRKVAQPAISVPPRRSARKRSFCDASIEASEEENVESVAIPAPNYVDSSVLQYTCTENPPLLPSLLSHCSSDSVFRITGRIHRRTLLSRSLTKIYAMDVNSLNEKKILVAAGGHGGIVSVFGVDQISDDGDIQYPLLNWKASKSWISGVRFVQDNPMLLLSASNDGEILVWDISKQPSTECSSSEAPPVVCRSADLHSGGIFSMDHFEQSVITSSKDSSVVISSIREDGALVAERTITGHHSGAIRGVCLRETKHMIADCGADRSICVLDARLPEPCTLTLESDHQTYINAVKWSLLNRNLLLSASKDPSLYLYDIRNPSAPLHELQGHVGSGKATCSRIYTPAFVGNGGLIATPGEGSRKVSMYRMDDGKLVSQGGIGYDGSMVFNDEHGGCRRMWVAGKQINLLTGVGHEDLASHEALT